MARGPGYSSMISRRWRKFAPIVLILTFLTPVAHWLSKDEDFDLLEPEVDRAKFVLPERPHRIMMQNNEMRDEKIPVVPVEPYNQRPVVHPTQIVQQVHNSLTVQLGDFPLHEDMITLLGSRKKTPGFVTIGIPTVLRKISGAQYLLKTLQSILNNLEDDEVDEVVILIFLADTDASKRNTILSEIESTFGELLRSGLLQVMSVNETAYPPLEGLKRNYDDTDERVTWRAKQVVDFAFMFYYAKNLSKFYLHLEDDVISAPYFLGRIKAFVNYQRSHWVALDFSMLGFIGKFMRSVDLEEFARFLLMFYDEQPADYLYSLYCKVLLQEQRILHKPTLFQHFGEHSSLKGKSQPSQDRYFALGRDTKLPVFTYVVNGTRNPPAFIITSITSYGDFIPESAYGDSAGYFWGKEPRANDVFLIVFQNSQRISAVSVETGRENQQNDYLRHGVVEISSEKNLTENAQNDTYNREDPYVSPEVKEVTDRYCANFEEIGVFDKGVMRTQNMQPELKQLIKCIRLRITQDQEEWLIINDINIKVYDRSKSDI